MTRMTRRTRTLPTTLTLRTAEKGVLVTAAAVVRRQTRRHCRLSAVKPPPPSWTE